MADDRNPCFLFNHLIAFLRIFSGGRYFLSNPVNPQEIFMP